MTENTATHSQAAGAGAVQTPGNSEKRFTQTELDAAVEKRLQQDHRKWQREQADASTEPKGSENENRLEKANRRHLLAEAKLAAVSLGVPAKRAGYAARLADLSNVAIDEEKGPDKTAIQKAVETVLRDIPELKGTSQNDPKTGLRIGANHTPTPSGAAPAPARVKPWNKFRI